MNKKLIEIAAKAYLQAMKDAGANNRVMEWFGLDDLVVNGIGLEAAIKAVDKYRHNNFPSPEEYARSAIELQVVGGEMITKVDIEKIVYRAMLKMWGTSSPDTANFIAHDVWEVVKQYLKDEK